jgi:hypothetical protein
MADQKQEKPPLLSRAVDIPLHMRGEYESDTAEQRALTGIDFQYPVPEELRDRLEGDFTYHAPHPDQLPRYARLRRMAYELAMEVAALCPPGRERSLAWTNIEQAIMYANAAIAREKR